MKKLVLWVGMSLITLGSVLSFSISVNNDSAIYNGDEVYRGMGQVRFVNAENTEKLSIEAQTEKVNAYLTQYDEALKIGDIFVYDDSETYFIVLEKETDKGAMELLVDPYSGNVYPEYGPNMMWNLKYGMMYGNYSGSVEGATTEANPLYNNAYGCLNGNFTGQPGMMYGGRGYVGQPDMMYGGRGYAGQLGMMNGGRGYIGQTGLMLDSQGVSGNAIANGSQNGYYNGMMGIQFNIDPTTDTPLTQEQVMKIATDYIAGLSLSKPVSNVEAHEFYGYYTLHLMAEDDMLGMFSVNAYTGDVWYHTWHGTLSKIIEND